MSRFLQGRQFPQFPIHFAKNAPTNVASPGFASGSFEFPQQHFKARGGTAGLRGELGYGRRAFGGNPVTPSFRFAEPVPVQSVLSSQCIQGRLNGVGVRVTHEFADELPLTPQGASRSHVPGAHDGLEERLIQPQFFKLAPLEGNEFLAQRLQRQMVSLARAFAGLCVVHPLSYLMVNRAMVSRRTASNLPGGGRRIRHTGMVDKV